MLVFPCRFLNSIRCSKEAGLDFGGGEMVQKRIDTSDGLLAGTARSRVYEP